MQKKFDWKTYSVEEELETFFDEDDENGYLEEDKYPNMDYGWKFIPSSKTKIMIQKIREIRQKTPNDKIIIFFSIYYDAFYLRASIKKI